MPGPDPTERRLLPDDPDKRHVMTTDNAATDAFENDPHTLLGPFRAERHRVPGAAGAETTDSRIDGVMGAVEQVTRYHVEPMPPPWLWTIAYAILHLKQRRCRCASMSANGRRAPSACMR